MSEQAAPAEGGTTPAVAGPEGTPGTAEQTNTQGEVNWQDRYQHLQPEYTRVTQEAAELRQQQELYDALLSTDDPDTRREIAEALGYELAEDEQTQPVDPDEDPLGQYDQRLGRIEESLTQQDQEREDAAYAEQVRAVVDERLDQLQIPKDDQDWVLAYAINALPITDEGLPDIGQAHQVFQAREVERQRAWAQSNRAPHISPHGQSATEVPNLDNRQERQDYMVRRLQENDQAGY